MMTLQFLILFHSSPHSAAAENRKYQVLLLLWSDENEEASVVDQVVWCCYLRLSCVVVSVLMLLSNTTTHSHTQHQLLRHSSLWLCDQFCVWRCRGVCEEWMSDCILCGLQILWNQVINTHLHASSPSSLLIKSENLKIKSFNISVLVCQQHFLSVGGLYTTTCRHKSMNSYLSLFKLLWRC